MFNGVSWNKLFVILLIVSTVDGRGHKKLPTVKYILQWTSGSQEPLVLMPTGHQPFSDCLWDNCFITRSKHYFSDVTLFDAILFRAADFTRVEELPQSRHPSQKYVFVSQEPASIYPLAQQPVQFFNMTWTYKLDSDITFREIIVKDRYGDDIGPQKDMKWINIDDMLPTDDFIISRLNNKSKAVAWIESNCLSLSRREEYVTQLFYELAKLGLTIDIFGECGPGGIRNVKLNEILRLLENQYYFYLAMEKAFDEDYVTEQLLYALQHFTVPIVYGGANYSRFMPEGIYLNARELSPKRLAQQINELIEDKELYYEFFRWRGYYSFFNPVYLKGESEYCQFCEVLNDETKMTKSVTYLNLAEWWNKPPSYRPQVHSRNYTEPHVYSRRYMKKGLFPNKNDDGILMITEDNYPDSDILELETEPSHPRAYTAKISKSGTKKKTKEKESKKKKKSNTAVSSKSGESSDEDSESHKHSHNTHEHDGHEDEQNEPLRFKIGDRILEWHDDLPEDTRRGAKQKPSDSEALSDVRHLNFFFDAPTLATTVYRSTDYYAPRKNFIYGTLKEVTILIEAAKKLHENVYAIRAKKTNCAFRLRPPSPSDTHNVLHEHKAFGDPQAESACMARFLIALMDFLHRLNIIMVLYTL